MRHSARRRGRNNDGALSDGDSDARHGLPHDENRRHLQVAAWRRNKAAAFMCSELTQVLLTVWLCVSGPCMRLHYKLFKEGQKKHKPEDKCIQFLCDLLELGHSMVSEILKTYVGMLSSTNALFAADGTLCLRWRATSGGRK